MSHNVHHSTYPENVNKASVQKEWDEYAAREDWQEGCSGLSQSIRWIDHVCDDLEDAHKYIEEHDRGWYDQLAVKYRATEDLVRKSNIKQKYDNQIRSYRKKIDEFNEKHSFETLKAQFITCPQCNSKLNRMELIKRYRLTVHCPVCNKEDIRAPYIPEKIAEYNKKIKETEQKRKQEEKALSQKLKSKAPVQWLVKIEYHT